jgi:CheY-like chemotaxis protein
MLSEARPNSILITDDDVAVRESLREIFEPAGFRLHLAESGEEAIDIAQRQEIHLVLMDMNLPRLTGLETMEVLKQIKGLLPMILISGDQDDQLLRRALQADAFCVLSKPVSRNVVVYVVSRAFEKFYWSPEPDSAAG